MNVVKVNSDLTRYEYLKDFKYEKQAISDNVMKKYEMLSQEYQSQAKQFKTKHEQIKKSEYDKR